jgi:diamine N-acetyltransferase
MTLVEVDAVDADNIESVLAVSAAPGQEAYVASVATYLALSAYQQIWIPVAFRVGDEIVGFAQWAFDPSDGTYTIGGVLIDAKRQGQGLGRRAMTALIDVLRERPDCGPIALTVDVDNTRAHALYTSLGFAETGEKLDGDLIMMLPG